MVSFCPKCRGLLIPGKNGALVCMKCGNADRRGTASLGDFGAGDTKSPAKAKKVERKNVVLSPVRPVGDDSLVGYFPHERMRPGQRDFVSDAFNALDNGEVLLAYAPTGIGKTAASLAPAVEYAKASGKTVCFLTSKQSQHHVAVETLREIVKKCGKSLRVIDMINKQDMCPLPEAGELYSRRFLEFCAARQKRGTCEYGSACDDDTKKRMLESILHTGELVDYCASHDLCPHRAGLAAAKDADVLICDYNYFFSDLMERMTDNLDKELSDLILIVDEAHNLPDRVRSNYTDRLTLNMLKEAKSEASKQKDSASLNYLNAISEALKYLAEGCEQNERGKKGSGEKSVGGMQLIRAVERFANLQRLEFVDYQTILTRLMNLGDMVLQNGGDYSHAYETGRFLDSWRSEENGSSTARTIRLDEDRENVIISYFLMDPSSHCSHVFRGVHAAFVMSGTLYPMEMYRDLLGIPEHICAMREYTSPFPPENRLTLVTKGFSTAYRNRSPKEYERMAGEISDIAMNSKGNVACFFPSYRLMDEIGGYIDTSKKLIWEERRMSKDQKQAIYDELVELKKNKSGGLLLGVQGGSLSEGVDYKDNLLSTVIIVGLPLAPPSLDVELTINHFERTYGKAKGRDYAYVYPAMNKVLQAAGRLIRSETDRGVVVLMDERFAWNSYAKAFPKSWKLRLVDDVGDKCKRFLNAFS